MSRTPETAADLRLHLIGYERFEISAKFLSAVEDEISVMQWGRPAYGTMLAVTALVGPRVGG